VTLGVIEDDDDDLDQVIETTDDWQLLEPQEPEAYKRLIVPSCSRSRFYQPLRILATQPYLNLHTEYHTVRPICFNYVLDGRLLLSISP
jgi:hypothetical protein